VQGGLDKLAEASTAVAELNAAAEPQRALLRQKQSEADAALTSIQDSMETAAERRREVEALTRELATSEVALTQQRGEEGWCLARCWCGCGRAA
jgi:transcriptional regulator GlxA family with amidase domain